MIGGLSATIGGKSEEVLWHFVRSRFVRVRGAGRGPRRLRQRREVTAGDQRIVGTGTSTDRRDEEDSRNDGGGEDGRRHEENRHDRVRSRPHSRSDEARGEDGEDPGRRSQPVCCQLLREAGLLQHATGHDDGRRRLCVWQPTVHR
jgi:hypothetical protein